MLSIPDLSVGINMRVEIPNHRIGKWGNIRVSLS